MLTHPRADLYDRIINRINSEEKRLILKRRLILNFFSLFLSFFVFVPLVLRLYSDISRSGIIQFISLLFTDSSIVMANIGDYVLTILESTPVMSLAFVSATLLAFVFFAAKLTDSYSDFKKLIIN